MKQTIETHLDGRHYSIETGRMAKQADGSVIIRSGDTMVLVTAVSARDAKPGTDFLPLTVDYQERTYAAGRIPGGFFKREARPTEKETLVSRLIDRPLRPLFPEGYNFEVQIIAQVISSDPNCDGDVLAITGASAALAVSDIPFHHFIAGCRVCRVEGRLVINPNAEELAKNDMELVVAATDDAIVMVEGGALEATESDIVAALEVAHTHIRKMIALQKDLKAKVSKVKREFVPVGLPAGIMDAVKNKAFGRMQEVFAIKDKRERGNEMKVLKKKVLEELTGGITDAAEKAAAVMHHARAFEDLQYVTMREMILASKKRIDARGFEDIRPITCEVGVLPRAHGSALFTRGETQALVSVTLGTKEDEQRIEALTGTSFRRFLLHYNFPPFSVGECKFLRGPGRREIGHGKLAERAIEKVLPDLKNDFGYTVRLVSEILESNGSSSMATVCGSSLALMDAGCRTRAHCAGIAMGLIKEGDRVAILSDILGDEDHLGDMDFKVCGTEKGVTSIQMDIKITGLTSQLMASALDQARRGRLKILEQMRLAIAQPRPEVSPFAPRTVVMMINPEKIKDVIGPGGKIIKGIIEETGVKIDIDDDGKVVIYSADPKAIEKAQAIVKGLVADPEVGMIYKGVVRRIMDFGAIVEIMPGTDGLVHISQLHTERVKTVDEVVKEGDEILVKVLEVDRSGKIRLSRKEALGKEVGTIHEVKDSELMRSAGGPPGGRRDDRPRR